MLDIEIVKWLKKRDLSMSMVMNVDSSKFCCICDASVISPELEQMVMEMLDPDMNSGEYIGFFIEKNNVSKDAKPIDRIVAVAICNIDDIQKDGSLMLEILCANSKLRVKHATLLLMNHIINTSNMYGFNSIKLQIATTKDNKPNQRALAFYTRLGFIHNPNTKHYHLNITEFQHPQISPSPLQEYSRLGGYRRSSRQ